MPYSNPKSREAKASNKRRITKYRSGEKYEKSRSQSAWIRYGIKDFSWEKYKKLLKKQKGKCAIPGCKWITKRRLCADHNHKTGKVRGLLCITHNRIAGEIENGSVGEVEKYLAGY